LVKLNIPPIVEILSVEPSNSVKLKELLATVILSALPLANINLSTSVMFISSSCVTLTVKEDTPFVGTFVNS